MRQQTIRRSVTLEGIGLHSGKRVRIVLSPAPADSGIIFRVGDGDPIPAAPESVVDSHYATTIGRNGTRIYTVEHLMAAAAGLGIDNLRRRDRRPRGPRDGRQRQAIRGPAALGRTHHPERQTPADHHPAPDPHGRRQSLAQDRPGSGVSHQLHPGQRPPGHWHPGPVLDADRGVVCERVRAGPDVRLPQGPRLPAQERPGARRLARQYDRHRQERHAERAPVPR